MFGQYILGSTREQILKSILTTKKEIYKKYIYV